MFGSHTQLRFLKQHQSNYEISNIFRKRYWKDINHTFLKGFIQLFRSSFQYNLFCNKILKDVFLICCINKNSLSFKPSYTAYITFHKLFESWSSFQTKAICSKAFERSSNCYIVEIVCCDCGYCTFTFFYHFFI